MNNIISEIIHCSQDSARGPAFMKDCYYFLLLF